MMQLIVLGIVPGTDIQMTFELIFNISAVLMLLWLSTELYRYHSGRSTQTILKKVADVPQLNMKQLVFSRDQLTNLLARWG